MTLFLHKLIKFIILHIFCSLTNLLSKLNTTISSEVLLTISRLPIHLDSILDFLASFHYISERNLRAPSTIFLNNIQKQSLYRTYFSEQLFSLHMCGEYAWIQFFSQSRKGSPPHAWRIPVTVSPTPIDSRITSTYVENTLNDPRYINISQSK